MEDGNSRKTSVKVVKSAQVGAKTAEEVISYTARGVAGFQASSKFTTP